MAVSVGPRVDRTAAETLGAALRNVGYTEDAVHELLGDEAYSIERDAASLEARRLPRSRLGTVIRLLFLQLPIARDEAESAVGAAGVEALAALGLAELDDAELRPTSRILAIGELLLASDGYSRELDDPPDYVATYTPTSRLCDSLTPRPRVARALDVGTGPGIHALLAARHAGHVIATDVNERALSYTELNAALNNVTNVEVRRGSLFEPVEGERFDLITCNAPYVVGPERRWTYRDTGHRGDELSERVVEAAAGHLAEGGFATLLVSWVAEDEESPHEHALSWVERTGCDGWIFPSVEADPLAHAEDWNSHLAGDPAAYAEAIEEWTRYLEELGVRWVSDGAILLHRRSGPVEEPRVDSIDEDDLEDAGDQILRAFAARARLARLESANALLHEPLSLAAALRLEEELEPDDGSAVIGDGYVRLADGTKTELEVDADLLDVLAALDGESPLGSIVGEVAERLDLSSDERAQLADAAVGLAAELLELGALGFAE